MSVNYSEMISEGEERFAEEMKIHRGEKLCDECFCYHLPGQCTYQ